MQTLFTSLLGESAEVVRAYRGAPAGARGVIRAVYLSGDPDREEVGGPRTFVYCLLQIDSGDLLSVEATYLRVIPGGRKRRPAAGWSRPG